MPSIMAKNARIKVRGGLKSKFLSFLTLNSSVRQRRSTVEMHEFYYNLQLLRPIGIELNEEEYEAIYPKLFITEEEEEEAYQDLVSVSKIHRRELLSEYIVIHPGMTGHTLNWSAKSYFKIAQEIEIRFPGRFSYIVSYTPNDKHYINQFKSALLGSKDRELLEKKMIYFDGQVKGIRNYLGVLKRASLFIGPSTGPLHMANALGKKILGVYSPILVQSALRWGPIPREVNRVRIIFPDVVCGEQFGCIGADCPYFECMERIGTDQAIKEVVDLISS